MKEIPVSVITVCFNSEKTIRDTIESVLHQSYKNIEYILIDGFSTDRTVDIIKSYEETFKGKGIPYTWISEPDKGIYDAFNKGINKSQGNWISFIGSDDCYTHDAREKYSHRIDTQSDYDLIYSNVKVVKNNKTLKIIDGIWSWNTFKRKMNIAHVGALHNRKYFRKYGLYDTSYKIAGDYELLLRAKEKLKAFKIDEITAIMSAGGISNNQIKNTYKETNRAKKETANVNVIKVYLEYYIWMLKYQIKRILHAFIR